jgi:hypothetical protein
MIIGEMMTKRYRVFGFQIRASVNKYGAALFALFSFFVEGSSAIGAASAIISHSPFRPIFGFGKSPSLRARAGTAVVDECD